MNAMMDGTSNIKRNGVTMVLEGPKKHIDRAIVEI